MEQSPTRCTTTIRRERNHILIGATTENPSFTVNSALLSRTKVFVFKQPTEEAISSLIKKIAKKEYPGISIGKKEIEIMGN